MCECLLTKREAAKIIKCYRDTRGRDAHLQLLEHLIWVFSNAHEEADLLDVEIGIPCGIRDNYYNRYVLVVR